jgi:hypothetical protein
MARYLLNRYRSRRKSPDHGDPPGGPCGPEISCDRAAWLRGTVSLGGPENDR